jgi:hypothetical protein
MEALDVQWGNDPPAHFLIYFTFLDRAVHSCNLPIGPRVVWLGKPMLDLIRRTNHVEAHLPGRGCVSVPGLICELDTIVPQDRVDSIWHDIERVLQEFPGCTSVSFVDELRDSKLACSVYANKEVKLALAGFHLAISI